jgi:O-methyltransferase involved in polyketide biosynthesis
VDLYHRAAEARRPDAVLTDPQAVEVVQRLDFPFAERFGAANALLAQAQALRVRCFDLELARLLRTHPDATVVALGAGLETQFSRVDNGRVHWLSVDLDASIAARRRCPGASTPPNAGTWRRCRWESSGCART